jgi:hypothetical protein
LCVFAVIYASCYGNSLFVTALEAPIGPTVFSFVFFVPTGPWMIKTSLLLYIIFFYCDCFALSRDNLAGSFWGKLLISLSSQQNAQKQPQLENKKHTHLL